MACPRIQIKAGRLLGKWPEGRDSKTVLTAQCRLFSVTAHWLVPVVTYSGHGQYPRSAAGTEKPSRPSRHLQHILTGSLTWPSTSHLCCSPGNSLILCCFCISFLVPGLFKKWRDNCGGLAMRVSETYLPPRGAVGPTREGLETTELYKYPRWARIIYTISLLITSLRINKLIKSGASIVPGNRKKEGRHQVEWPDLGIRRGSRSPNDLRELNSRNFISQKTVPHSGQKAILLNNEFGESSEKKF